MAAAVSPSAQSEASEASEVRTRGEASVWMGKTRDSSVQTEAFRLRTRGGGRRGERRVAPLERILAPQVFHEADAVRREDHAALGLRLVQVDVARDAEVAVAVRVVEHLPHVPDVS